MAAQHQTVLGTLVLMTCSAIVGYWIGVGRSLGITRGSSEEEPDAEVRQKPSAAAASSKASSSSGSDVDLTDGDHIGDIAQVKAGLLDDCKLILVVRTDLGMTKGKIAAQCGHATLACYKALQKDNPALLKHWERTGQAKIAVKADSEDELLVLQAQAQSLNICAKSIQDAGRTQIAAGSRTVLGIGPAPSKLINQVTGSLKLLHFSTASAAVTRLRLSRRIVL